MSIFRKLFGRGDEGLDAVPTMPWDERPSILDHIRAHTDPNQPGLTDGGDQLPDEERVCEGSQIRWAAGAMDGVMGHHMGQGNNDELVGKAVELILGYCVSPTAKTKQALYAHVMEGNALPLIDPIIQELSGNEKLNHERLYELAFSFVTEAPDREPVKFGIAILGMYRNLENESLFQTIGRHEEFTLYCAVALSNLCEDPEASLWALAKNVNGWGRIHVVERLAQTENEDIKRWMLREGYRNSIMYEYLAYTCATTGGLLSALSEESVDRELLNSAGELLAALISGGPAESIESYADGVLAVEMFLGQMESSAETLADFVHVLAIKQYLADDEADWDSQVEQGWTEERRTKLLGQCEEILRHPQWLDRARVGLSSEDSVEFYQANQVAEALGLETWEIHWNRLQKDPSDTSRWYEVMSRCNDERIASVVSFAETNIDLAKIATGAANELGLGPGFEPHLCLDFVVQNLGRFAGHGERLIETGLKSPAVRGRNTAVAALAEWGQERWSDEIRLALEVACKVEPEDDVRERMESVLSGESIEE